MTSFLTEKPTFLNFEIKYKYKCNQFSEGKGLPTRQEVVGDIGPMGEMRGVIKQAQVYADAPHSGRTIYMFR